jgi:hypothetical protein
MLTENYKTSPISSTISITVGATVGAVVAFGIVCMIIWWWRRRRSARQCDLGDVAPIAQYALNPLFIHRAPVEAAWPSQEEQFYSSYHWKRANETGSVFYASTNEPLSSSPVFFTTSMTTNEANTNNAHVVLARAGNAEALFNRTMVLSHRRDLTDPGADLDFDI